MQLKIFANNNYNLQREEKDSLIQKLDFLNRFLDENDRVSVTITKQKKRIKIAIFFIYNNKPIKINETGDDFYYALDEIEDTLKPLMEKRHDLKLKQEKDIEETYRLFENFALSQQNELITNNESQNDEQQDITKEKIIVPKPMTEENAKSEMKKCGFETYIFINADKNNAYCSLYTRNNGDLGMLVMSEV